jgi:ankyrin repeat protein
MNETDLYEKFKDLNQEKLNSSLISACQHGIFDEIKFLLNSPKLTIHADILATTGNIGSYSLKTPLSAACKDGHLDVVKYLLNATELKQHADIKQKKYHALFEATMYGWFDIVKYLLELPELKENYSINMIGNDGGTLFGEAAHRGRVDIVKYLLESNEFKKHIDVHENEDFAFKCGLRYNTDEHKDLIKYLIFDHNIKKTENIKKHLKTYPSVDVEKWLELNDLNHTLENELVSVKIDRNKQIKL